MITHANTKVEKTLELGFEFMPSPPHQIMQLLNDGARALSNGQLDVAERHLCDVLKWNPDEPNALFLLGGVRKKQRKLEDAAALMQKALAAHPNPAQVNNSLGNIYQESGKTSDAIAAYEAAIGTAPTYAEAYFNLGLMLHSAEQFALALQNLEKAVSINSNNPAFLNALGTSYKELKRQGDAELMFKKAIKLHPHYVKALHNLGVLLRNQYRTSEAMSCLLKAVELAPKVIEPRLVLANIYYELGEITKADEAYRTIIAIQPDCEDAHNSLNRMYWEHGHTDLYGKSYIVGIKASPGSVGLCEKHLLALENVGRIDEALGYAQNYLSSFPKHAGLHKMAARLNAFGGNSDTAIDLYETAMKLDPDNASICLDASKHMLQLGDYDGALGYLDVADRLEPNNQRLWAYKSLCWRMQGDTQHEWLNNYDILTKAYVIETPNGYSNTAEFLDALKADLKKYHTTKRAPVDQTLKGGSQTHGMLFDRPDQTIRQLKEALRAPVQSYIDSLACSDRHHPLYRRNTGAADFATSWSIWLRDGGFHVNHIHTMGWISSSFYVDMPASNAKQNADREGWIKFGESGLLLGGHDKPVKFIQPKPGMLVLFPSYMWHGTVPFHQPANRITAPFDLLPV